MPVPVELLNQLASSLRINLTGPSQAAPGQAVPAEIGPSLAGLDVTDVLTGDMNLTWITKDVRFSDFLTEPSLEPAGLDPQILGGMPISGLNISGVPGVLGQLAGTIPIPSTTTLPVQVQVEWSVSSDQGGQNALVLGTDFLAPGGLTSPTASFVFRPDTVELTTDPLPPPVPRYLQAKVRVSAGTTQTDWITLPAVPVLVPSLAIPTVLAMFLHAEFQARSGDDDGAVLVLVPAISPLASVAQLQPVLDTLQAAASALSSFAGFAAFVAGLGELTGALPPQPHAQFRSTNQISNLNDITLIQRGFFENDTEAEDELSSVIFIGPSGKQAQCFNARDFNTDEGALTLTVGTNFFTLVRNLDGKSPVSEPANLIQVDTVPPGGLFNPDKFNDELSSVRFP